MGGHMYASTITSSAIALVTLTCLVVLCCESFLKKWRDDKMEKEDSNTVYGL